MRTEDQRNTIIYSSLIKKKTYANLLAWQNKLEVNIQICIHKVKARFFFMLKWKTIFLLEVARIFQQNQELRFLFSMAKGKSLYYVLGLWPEFNFLPYNNNCKKPKATPLGCQYQLSNAPQRFQNQLGSSTFIDKFSFKKLTNIIIAQSWCNHTITLHVTTM